MIFFQVLFEHGVFLLASRARNPKGPKSIRLYVEHVAHLAQKESGTCLPTGKRKKTGEQMSHETNTLIFHHRFSGCLRGILTMVY